MKINTHILSTVLLDQALIEAALKQGVEIDAISFIDVEPIRENNLNDELEELCKLPLTAVFTSANAIKAIGKTLHNFKPKWNVYCIGNATRNAVLEYFDASLIKGIANNAEVLAGIIHSHNILEVVFFCGDKRLDALPDILYNNEITVHEIVVYKTRETPEEIRKHYAGILFFSPNGVNSFFSVNTLGSQTALFAIGKTTASAIKAKSNNNVVVSDVPSKEQLVDKVIQYFHKETITGQQ